MVFKHAIVSSALAPPFVGRGMSGPARPAVTPGLGEKMRTETGHALEQALSRGSADALSHFGLKAAGMGAPIVPMSGLSMPKLNLGRFARPAGKALGLAALGAGGALALGMHHQNQEDRAQHDLVYAPLGGYQ